MKKGFTLIELLVSIVLLSIVMLFMTNLVISFKEQKESINIDVGLMTNQAVISKTINSDITSKGLDNIICNTSINCDITFDDSSVKTIEITDNGTSIKYYDGTPPGTTVYLVRTLSNDTFAGITFTTQTLTEGTFTKIIIGLTNNPEYNIEIYNY